MTQDGPARPWPVSHRITRPDQWAAGVIFASPHSGRDYPAWFLAESALDPLTLRSSEDAFVDRLAAPGIAAGAVLLTACGPRCLIDVNRAADELDPRAVAGVPPRPHDPRILSGLGVIPRVVGQGRAIRHGKLTAPEAAWRIDAYWRPYHAALAALMDEAVARFGQAVLIDLHSMPAEALAGMPGPRPQVVIGDRNGRSAAPWVSGAVQAALRDQGFAFRMNAPFAGAHVAAAYGRPNRRRHVVQIEIDRSLYMDECRVVPHDGFAGIAARLGAALQRLARLDGGQAAPVAAE